MEKKAKQFETKPHTRFGYVAAFGRAYCYITCPFCEATVKAFVWSLSGSGKRCTCGALHSSFGQTLKEIKHGLPDPS